MSRKARKEAVKRSSSAVAPAREGKAGKTRGDESSRSGKRGREREISGSGSPANKGRAAEGRMAGDSRSSDQGDRKGRGADVIVLRPEYNFSDCDVPSSGRRRFGALLAFGMAFYLLLSIGWEVIADSFPQLTATGPFGWLGRAVGGAVIEICGVSGMTLPVLFMVLASKLWRAGPLRLRGALTLGTMLMFGLSLVLWMTGLEPHGHLLQSYLWSPLLGTIGAGGASLVAVALLAPPVGRGAWSQEGLFSGWLLGQGCRQLWALGQRLISLTWRGAGQVLSFLATVSRGVSICCRRALGVNRTEMASSSESPSLLGSGLQASIAAKVAEAGGKGAVVAGGFGVVTESLAKRGTASILRRNNEAEKRGEPSSVILSGDYAPPPLSILKAGHDSAKQTDQSEIDVKKLAGIVNEKLEDFGIKGSVKAAIRGPVITLVEYEPARGVKVGKIASLGDDLKMALKAPSVRIVAPLPGRGTVGIEIPNKTRDLVTMRPVLEAPDFLKSFSSSLPVALGRDAYGNPVVIKVATMPHLLIAGATGTGKSVCINTILVSLLARCSPQELGLILVDPKVLELSVYEGIPHLLVPVVTVAKEVKAVLGWAVKEMERRYRLMQRFAVRNIDSFNALVSGELNRSSQKTSDAQHSAAIEGGPQPEKLEHLPKIVIVIDELADLMFQVGRDIEELITRLAQKARAAGIHLIVATQRPSVDVITGLIKANFPARLSFRVTSKVDSRTILDSMGAETLLGKGDMLLMQPGAQPLRRVHGAFIADEDVNAFVADLKGRYEPRYNQSVMKACQEAIAEEEGDKAGLGGDELEYDSMYDKAVEFVKDKGFASTSMIQRVFRIGYNRAARIVDMMEKDGVVGPMDGVRPREVLIKQDGGVKE